MFHIIYRTTNLVNGFVYYGKHSTKNPNDGYIGSGSSFKEAVKKFGRNNFVCEHIFFAFSENDAYEVESQIVNESFLKRKDVYNKKPGGKGAASGIYNHNFGKSLLFTDEHKQNISLSRTGELNWMFGKTGLSSPLFGRKHSEETKIKISKSIKESQKHKPVLSGDKNHRFGKEHNQSSKEKMRSQKIKWSYTITDPEGNVYKTNNMTQFCKDHPVIHQTNMSKHGHSKGWKVIEKLPFEG